MKIYGNNLRQGVLIAKIYKKENKMKLELDLPEVDYKEEIRYKSCLNYVIKNFNELEPIIREHWIKKEMKKLEKDKER